MNVLDLTRRRNSLENRIVKYFVHGFALALPDFDIGAMKRGLVSNSEFSKFVAQLPFLKIIGDSCWNGGWDNYCANVLKTKTMIAESLEADGAAPKSSYSTFAVDYRHAASSSEKNFSALARPKVNTAGLVAIVDLDKVECKDFSQSMFSSEVVLDRGAVAGWLGRMTQQSPRSLPFAIGERAAKALVGLLIDGAAINFDKLAERLCEVLVKHAGDGTVIPFRFMHVGEDTAVGPLKMAPMTPAEWYGAYHLKPVLKLAPVMETKAETKVETKAETKAEAKPETKSESTFLVKRDDGSEVTFTVKTIAILEPAI